MKVFKSLKNCLYKYNDRLPIRMAQVDSSDGKLRISTTDGFCLSSFIFKKIKNKNYYYVTSSMLDKLANSDKFKFKNGCMNNIVLIEDGGSVRICDNSVTIGSYQNREAKEHFPNVDSVIPTDFKFSFIVDRKKLVKSLKDEEHITLKFYGNKLHIISSKYKPRAKKIVRANKSKAILSMECLNGELHEYVSFDAKKLKNVLCVPSDEVCLRFNGTVSALGIYYDDDDLGVRNLIMPVRSSD